MADMANFELEYQANTMEEYWDFFSGDVDVDDCEQPPMQHAPFDIGISAEAVDAELERLTNKELPSPFEVDPYHFAFK